MSAINFILRKIRSKIPERILIEAFTKGEPEGLEHYVSLDERITEKVIRGQVMLDLNIYSQRVVHVPLNGLQPKIDYYNNAVFKIPLDRTFGSYIVRARGFSPTSFNPLSGEMSALTPTQGQKAKLGCFKGNWLTDKVEKMVERSKGGGGGMDYNVEIEVKGPNVVLLHDCAGLVFANLILECVLEYDSQLNQIKPTSYPILAEAAVLATKAYIYQQLFLDLDSGALEYGQSFGRFDQIIEGYESASDDYDEYIKMKVRKVLFANDHKSFSDYVRLIANSNS